MAKAIALCGVTLDKDGMVVPAEDAKKEFLTMLCGLTPDPKEQCKIIIEAWADRDKMAALNAVRVEQVENFIAVMSVFGPAYFESVTLADNEEPFIQNTTRSVEYRINYIGEDGTPDRARVQKPGSKVNIPLRFLESEIIRYKTLDLYKGRIAEIATVQFDIARDLSIKRDQELFTLLSLTPANGGAFGAFSYEQGLADKTKRIYVAHSALRTEHLPTTNDIDLTAPPYSYDRFQIGVIFQIVNYSDSWGTWLPDAGGQRLIPTGDIIVPASDIIDIAITAEPSMNVPESRIQEQINTSGYTSVSYLGRTWRFIPDATIPKGTCYPVFGLKPGRLYLKPTFDREIVDTNERENWEQRSQRTVFGAYIISQHRPRALRIKYAP